MVIIYSCLCFNYILHEVNNTCCHSGKCVNLVPIPSWYGLWRHRLTYTSYTHYYAWIWKLTIGQEEICPNNFLLKAVVENEGTMGLLSFRALPDVYRSCITNFDQVLPNSDNLKGQVIRLLGCHWLWSHEIWGHPHGLVQSCSLYRSIVQYVGYHIIKVLPGLIDV